MARLYRICCWQQPSVFTPFPLLLAFDSLSRMLARNRASLRCRRTPLLKLFSSTSRKEGSATSEAPDRSMPSFRKNATSFSAEIAAGTSGSVRRWSLAAMRAAARETEHRGAASCSVTCQTGQRGATEETELRTLLRWQHALSSRRGMQPS